MVNYANGKVYRIICNVSGLQYVGSTTQPLYKRLSTHKAHFKQWTEGKYPFVSSFKVLESDNYDICLLEEVICESKDQLHRAERKWIETLDCVNRCVPTRTFHEWYHDNRQLVLEQKKQYYKDHIDSIKAKDSERIQCPCGSEHTKGNKAQHLKTAKHQAWLQASSSDQVV